MAALHDAMGVSEDEELRKAPLLIVHQNISKSLDAVCDLRLEDGAAFAGISELPAGLPIGYHTLLNSSTGAETRLIVAPKKCFLHERFRVWGWTVQLYGLRSRNSWGIGDLEDLRRFLNWSSRLGARVAMINPLGASAPTTPQQPSPYFPSSRLFRSLLYLRIELVPGANEPRLDLESISKQGHALNNNRHIERDEIFRLKMNALERIWPGAKLHISMSAFEREAGPNLDLFAAYCVLAEKYGPGFRQWPQDYRDTNSTAVRRLITEDSDRFRFFKWIQWLVDLQLKHACESGQVMQDLPVGVDPHGADAWIWQDIFAQGVSVGAPPDPFSAEGQDWGLPPFIPHKLREACYEPFIQTVRSAMRHSAGLRIDHVMGLFRLFWITNATGNRTGSYVRYNPDEMLAILALESVRAKAFVVGEDLGTVEDGVREKLADSSVLSYRVVWFEKEPPASYPELALAAVSTHDLPTIAGAWTRADEESTDELRTHLRVIAGVEEDAPVTDVVAKTYEALAQAPSAVVVASLEDALGVEERPNLPGSTNDKRPNWSIPLPQSLEEIEANSSALEVAKILSR